MKRKTLSFVVILLLALAMVLAACGGDAGEEPGGEVAEPGVEVVEEEAPLEEEVVEEEAPLEEEEVVEEEGALEEEGVEEAVEEEPLEEEEGAVEEVEEVAEGEEEELGQRPEGGILIWADDTRAPVLQELVPQFEEELGIPVAVEQPADIRADFVIAAPAGEGPDIIVGAHDWIGQLVENGLLAPIDLAGQEDQFVELAIEAFTYEGELYGMPVATENVAFFRNTELVPEAPETWEEVLAICEEIQDQVEQCFAQREGDPYHFFPIQTAFGGGVFGQTEEGQFDPNEVLIDDPGSIEAAEFLDTMREEGFIGTGVDYEIAHTLFEEGEAAFLITGPWALERIDESGVPYAISPIPAGTEPGQPFLGVQGFMVNAFSEAPLEAQLFLTEFIATEEVMAALAEATNRPSAYIPVLETQLEESEVLASFAEAGEAGVPMPAIPEMASVWDAWESAIQLIVQGNEEPNVAFQNAAEQIRTLIEGA
ncbi:MAG: maltose ABC transporter substrate-binding protein [Chloroflexota bacterium]|nr:maltose ABC transporter substrate-binding protein [Chloroflexota bacterium]